MLTLVFLNLEHNVNLALFLLQKADRPMYGKNGGRARLRVFPIHQSDSLKPKLQNSELVLSLLESETRFEPKFQKFPTVICIEKTKDYKLLALTFKN